MKHLSKYFFCFFVLFACSGFSQQTKIDSLLTVLKNSKEDTNKVKTLDELSAALISSDPQQSMDYAKLQLKTAMQLNWKKGYGKAYHNMGYASHVQGNLPEALGYWLKALKAREDVGDKTGIAGSLGNIGIIYRMQGDYKKALSYYFRSLKMLEELGNKTKITAVTGNIGSVYYNMGGNTSDTAVKNDNYRTALRYYFRALKLAEDLGNKGTIDLNLGNIGSLYKDMGNYDLALEYGLRALKVSEEIQDENGMARDLANIGAAYLAENKLKEADTYLHRALDLSIKTEYAEGVKEIEHRLSELCGKRGEWKASLEHFQKYINARDSLFNEENTKKSVRLEMNYEFDKTQAEAKLAQATKDAEAEKEKQKQKIVLWSVVVGLLLVLVFSVLLFTRFRITQRQKKIIERQKILVDEKNKDITDSINYAQRIQKALLASDSLLNKNLGEHFVLFKPKDIVSGDFYWATEVKSAGSSRFYFAICDSTGHGVPGAFMSLLNISFLNEAINEEELVHPNEIFNHVRQRLIENISADGAKDGMDGILVCFDKSKNEITYTGANNAPIVVQDGNILELEADKMPVGMGDKTDSFKLETLNLKPGSILYLYTDGFADQFGGPKGKKFKYKQLNELLLSVATLPMADQKQQLENVFESWKGKLEQVDDVLVVGIRI